MKDAPRSSPDKTRAAVAALWTKFSGKLFERLAVLERVSEALLDGRLDDELRHEAETEAHKLAGSLGTFGLAEGSRLAEELESILQPGGPLNQAESHRVSELAGSLRKELERYSSSRHETPAD